MNAIVFACIILPILSILIFTLSWFNNNYEIRKKYHTNGMDLISRLHRLLRSKNTGDYNDLTRDDLAKLAYYMFVMNLGDSIRKNGGCVEHRILKSRAFSINNVRIYDEDEYIRFVSGR